ncbi:RNA polymerase II-binding domain-containing protein [Apodospora peruviana]|uniref:RNA polymerase II-binding domain-containing protein n=1 Tax=Apodospora peruviana TaxID=516989 RepID=A0AAE0IHM6_9PEZI|nr:RNA polymerase II-binding domain-containing protein [Apodospora peruviana]
MAYTDDAVLSKLSALNESHDSIATTAQWIMFHRRHAPTTVQLWLQKIRDLPSPKRLNMIYLANEVTQQSKARHKDDFLHAFSPFIADATALAYKGANADIQSKLRRVVDVWRDRAIFERDIQDAMEARLDELDKAKHTNKVGGFGGSVFSAATVSSAAVPSEIAALVAPQQSVSKAANPAKNAFNTANAEYEKLTDPSNPLPAAPVHAARLSGLLKSLASAEGLVTESMKHRKELIGELEKILTTHREAYALEERQLHEVRARLATTEAKKQEIELAIMGGNLPLNIKEQSPSGGHPRPSGSPVPVDEPDRPQVEALTPPHVQDADNDDDLYDNSSAPVSAAPPQNGESSAAASAMLSSSTSPPPPQGTAVAAFPSAPGIEMLSALASQYHAVPVNGSSSNKKRKIEASSGDDFPDLGGDDGIDADVAEMLRKDSHQPQQQPS